MVNIDDLGEVVGPVGAAIRGLLARPAGCGGLALDQLEQAAAGTDICQCLSASTMMAGRVPQHRDRQHREESAADDVGPLGNLPAAAQALPEGVKGEALPTGTKEGRNDWKRTGYGGPCPPIGRHRYFHKLYALDTILPDLGVPSRPDLERAMAGHILAQAELIATYEKARR